MNERWRKPVIIDSCEPAPEVIVLGDRLVQEEVVILKNQEDIQRIREGYVCPNCFEPFEIPFPVTCNVCAFPVRAEHNSYMQEHYSGKVWIGPRQSISDELEELAERDERKNHKPGSSIVLPRGVNLNN